MVDVGHPDGVAALQALVENVSLPEGFPRRGARIDDDRISVHGLDGGDEGSFVFEPADFDLPGPALQRRIGPRRPLPQLLLDDFSVGCVANQKYPFLAGRDGVGLAVAVEVDHPMIVHRIQLAIQHGRFPGIGCRMGRNLKSR